VCVLNPANQQQVPFNCIAVISLLLQLCCTSSIVVVLVVVVVDVVVVGTLLTLCSPSCTFMKTYFGLSFIFISCSAD